MIRIRWRLFLSFTALTVLVALLPALVTGVVLRRNALDKLETELAQQARSLSVVLLGERTGSGGPGSVEPGTPAGSRLQDVIRNAGSAADARITLIGPDGLVLADSERDPATMENHGDRPEVAVALAGGEGRARRSSETLAATLVYVAVPLDKADPNGGALRLAVPASRVDTTLRSIWWIPLLVALVSLLPVFLLTYLVARSITDPIERLKSMACNVAAGDLSYRVGALRRDELGQLGGALNEMAQSLQQQVHDLADARDQTDAILSSLEDGVLVLDRAGTVLRANAAAGALLDFPGTLEGRPLLHVARSFAASSVLQRALRGSEAENGEVEGPGGVLLAVAARPLRAHPEHGDRASEGPVLVFFRDETARRRVERMRRDFVANVSHELKTPLARLSLLASSLRHAIEEDPERAREFTARLSVEVAGLSALVEDLLTLSRVVEEESLAQPLTEDVDLGEIAREVVDALQPLAEAAGHRIHLAVAGPAFVRGDRHLLETLLRNLVDNGLRYNRPDGQVWVRVEPSSPSKDNGMVTLSVADDGVGIPLDQQDRVFERFYQVDPARSAGGTGLGLSIVRHVAERHGAAITLTSRVGQGSTFLVRFPS